MTCWPNDPPLMWYQTRPSLIGCTACHWTATPPRGKGWVTIEKVYRAHLNDTHKTVAA